MVIRYTVTHITHKRYTVIYITHIYMCNGIMQHIYKHIFTQHLLGRNMSRCQDKSKGALQPPLATELAAAPAASHPGRALAVVLLGLGMPAALALLGMGTPRPCLSRRPSQEASVYATDMIWHVKVEECVFIDFKRM